MNLNLPSRVRAALYIITMIGTPVIVYFRAKGIIGELEVGLWSGLVTVVTGLAALNVNPDGK